MVIGENSSTQRPLTERGLKSCSHPPWLPSSLRCYSDVGVLSDQPSVTLLQQSSWDLGSQRRVSI